MQNSLNFVLVEDIAGELVADQKGRTRYDVRGTSSTGD